MAGMANWQAQISIDIDDLKKRIKVAEGELDKIEKKEHKVKLDIDTKTLENAVIKLDRMLESLGKGSGDFKEFENLSKQLSSITTDINNISKAFSVMNDGSDFANSIKSIDISLTALSNHFVSEMSGRMTSSIKEVKSTLSDIGDGGELVPLLQTINKIENAINELSTSVKGIGLNMNIDVGSDSEMEAKVQSKIANALQAYQRLFDHIKTSSAGGSVINTNFFEFDINQYDTMMGKLQAYKKFIDNMRKEAKAQFNGKDVLYQDTEKSYWTQASAAMGQVTKAFNEMNAASDTNPLKDLFGSGDLSEVVSQLGLIVKKLEEISNTASSFKNVFKEGFNVTASVEEIDKLTNRVKELEDELSKIKLNPVNVDKSNISSENSIRNVLPSDSEFKNVIENLDLTKSKLGEIVKITRQAHADKDGKFYESFTLTDRNGSTETYGESSKTSKGQLLNYKYIEASTKAVEQESKALNQAWEEANKVNNALNETKNTLSSLPRMTELDTQFSSLDAKLSSLNSELTSGKISVADYKKEVKSLTAEYSKLVTIQQNRDVETYKQNAKAAEQEAKAVKEEWDKNVKAIQNYMDAVTKLNNLNAKDKGSGKYSSQIALQEKNVEELKEKALEARTAIASMINPHDVPLNTWRDYLNVMKKFDQASLGSAESVAKLEDALRKMDFSSLESAGTKFDSQFKNLSIKPDGDHQFLSWTNDLKELNIKIDEYSSKVKYLKENNIVDGEQVDEVKKLRDEIEETINVMTKTPQAKRGWTDIGASKAAEKVANVLKQNTKMSKEAKDAIRAYYNELRSGNPSQPIDEILVKVNQLVQKERELGRVGKSFGEIFKEKVIYGGAAQLAGMVGFYDVINVIRQAGEAVIDLNTNITELAKVSEASVSQIYDDFNSYADIAKEVGGTISDTISATADWSRNGYNIPDSKELAEVAMIYKNVGDGIDIDQANEYLISTLRGFSLEAKDAMDIIDSINEVANNEPISSAGIGEALQRSAAAFNVANTSLQESIALVTSTNSVLQSPEKVGSMWTTVSARIRGAKTELEDAGLETDGMVESTSKLQAMIKGMTGFDILEDDQKTFKSIYDIIIGIGEEFQNLSGVDQAALLEALAGKRQSNALAATLNNIDLLKKAYGEATNAEGSAMAEQEKYQQSIQYSIDRTKASLEELANDFISSDFLKGLIDSGDKLINILDLLIDKFGVLGTAGIIGGGILGANNLGKTYKCMVFKYNCFEYALYDGDIYINARSV